MKKRTLNLFFCVCMILGLIISLSAAASAETSGTCGDNLTWTLDDEGTLVISGTGDMNNYNLFNNKTPFRTIGSINTVIIEDGVTSIGSYAFDNCQIMKTVTISDTVKSIGKMAFESCLSLTDISIGKNTEEIGVSAFYHCSRLKSVNIPDSVTYIGNGAFDECGNLTDITLGKGIQRIGQDAFSFAKNIGMVYYRGTAEDWCKITFESERSNPLAYGGSLYINGSPLKTLTAGKDTDRVGQYTFYGCGSLESINTDDTDFEGLDRTTFLNCAFYENSENWKDGTLQIGNAIADILPDSKFTMTKDNYIVPGVFPMASSDLDITVDSGNADYYTDDYGTLYYKNSLLFLPLKGKSDSLIIGDNIDHINSGNFAHSDDVFTGKVRYPSDFHMNDSGYENIKVIHFGKNIKYLENDDFFPNLEKASGWCGENVQWELDVKTGMFHIFGSGDTYDYDSQIDLPWKCFTGYIKQVKIDDGITALGDRMLVDAAGDIRLPATLLRIGETTFFNADMENLYMPDSVVSIADCAFLSCGQLSKIYYGGTEDDWNKISIGEANEILETVSIVYASKGTKTEVSENGKTFNIEPVNIKSGNTVILALYDGERFIGMETGKYIGENLTLTTDKAYTAAKIMVWNDVGGIIPQAVCEEIKN